MAAVTATFSNRVTELLGVDIPIVQAPMGWIARSQLASAVSNAGAMGIIETSSGELDIIREEIRKMRELTDKPFGVNIAQAFVRDPSIVEFDTETNAMVLFGNAMELYLGGDMEAAVALSGQVAGRIDEIRPVADIIGECARDCLQVLADLAKPYPR